MRRTLMSEKAGKHYDLTGRLDIQTSAVEEKFKAFKKLVTHHPTSHA
jgi:hypothetical protein